jgi:hypothetical protein
MKTYEERTRINRVHVRTKCDLCGMEQAVGQRWPQVEGADDHGAFNHGEVTIECEYGYGYPDGGEVTHVVFDLFPRCFMSRLVPWLKEQGAAPTVKTVDF